MNILSDDEIKKITEAFLQHPAREVRGATQEEILSVIRWAEKLKHEAMLRIEILTEICETQSLVLDIRPDGEIVMKVRDVPVS